MKKDTRDPLMVFAILAVIVFIVIGLIGGVGGFKDRPILGADTRVYTDKAYILTEVKDTWDNILIDLNGDIEIKVDPDAPGTLLTVKDWFLYRGYTCRAEHVVITVRTEEQKKAWEERIERARKEFKLSREPKDILP